MSDVTAQIVNDRVALPAEQGAGYARAAAAAVLGLGGAAVVSSLGQDSLLRFWLAYLLGLSFFLSIAVGGLFFVLLHHLTRAGWSVNVRRIAEAIAATLPVLGLVTLPLLAMVALNKGVPYSWAQSADHLHGPVAAKRAYLNAPFFIVRVLGYMAIWAALAWWYWRQSTGQDRSGDPRLTRRMQSASALSMVVLALTLTLGSFDLLMSLDPHWFSTIFGVYVFSGSAVAIFAAMVVLLALLQKRGYMARGITVEHYHDLGKFLFAFVFFWGYIAFSQFMLIWYANIPEETAWFVRRGATSAAHQQNAWTAVSLLLLFGHLLIPFAALLSRSAKRRKGVLVFWAVWMLVFHWLDLAWLIMPTASGFRLGVVEVLATLGIGGVFAAALLRNLAAHSLRPLRDPRVEESLAYENV